MLVKGRSESAPRIAGNRNQGAPLKSFIRIASHHVWLPLLILLPIMASTRSMAQENLPSAPSPASDASPQHGLPGEPQSPATPPQNGPDAGKASANGAIQGVVNDREGAVYQGVAISLTQPATRPPAPALSAISDADGRFAFASVLPGPFVLTASAEGFTTQKIYGILHPGETFQAPAIVLLVSAASSEIHVYSASKVEIAQFEMIQEEHQHVLGIVPNFYVVYSPDAPALNSRQKFHLAWRSSIDPFGTLFIGAAAGVEQATNAFSGYGQGAQGYAKRFGAGYADNFIETMIGGAILPSLFRQDPRYFWKGTGTIRQRTLYAIANSVICKGDNGHWQFNYSGILGGLAAGGISNLYYPASDRSGISLTLQNALLGVAESAVGNIFQEFVARRFTPKSPNP